MVKLARVSRASFYRFDEDVGSGADSDMDLRDAIQRIALEWPSYGRRRITRGTAPPRLGGELEAGLSADARGQSAVRAEAKVRGDDRFQPRTPDMAEPGAATWC